MNIIEKGAHGPARVQYLDGDFRVIAQGAYVLCAVSGRQIPLEDLRYWNVDLQEAYFSATEAMARFHEGRKGKG